MKKIISPSKIKSIFQNTKNRILQGKNRSFLPPWIIYHGGLFLALAVSLFFSPVRINSSLMEIIPSSAALKSASRADAVLGERNSRQIVILSSGEDFAGAKNGAEELFAALSASVEFEALSLYADESFLSGFTEYLYDHRFMLLDRETRDEIENDPASVAEDALVSIFSPFTITPLDNLAGDPFSLTERLMKKIIASALLSSGNLSPRDDVLAAQYEGNWYVMIRGTIAPGGLVISGRENTVKRIYDNGALVKEKNPGVEFYYSGVPFHSYESSSNAQREISIISTVSLVAILVLFFIVFRFPVPVFCSFAAACFSILTAFVSVLLLFREVHVISFVFGTTLIGTCVDYSIHFFAHRFSLSGGAENGAETRRHILKSVSVCFVSTSICFGVLLFAPFVILKQFAVFSIFGLSSSFLTVICIFPLIRINNKKLHIPSFFFLKKDTLKILNKIRIIALSCFFTAFIVLLAVNRAELRIENKLADLYSMPQKLAKSERIAAHVLNYASSGWYYLVAGSDPEQLLQNEEILCAALEAEIAAGNLTSYMAASSFYPSIQTQERSYRSAEKLLPLAAAQFDAIGFPAEAAGEYKTIFGAAKGNYLYPASAASGGIQASSRKPAEEIIANLWIGKTGDMYYSCVLPRLPKQTMPASNDDNFRKIADGLNNVFFVNKMKDTGEQLDRLTKTMLHLFLAAIAAVVILVRRFYRWKQTARIFIVPVFLVLTVLTTLSCLHIPVSFFAAVGILLIFGLGLDYIIFGIEAENHANDGPVTAIAISLSFATTAIAFGALALSSFVPAHIFGVSVFSGISAAYIFSTLLSFNSVSENQKNSGSAAEK